MDLMAAPERARELARSSRPWPSIPLEPGQLADLELLLNGSLAPLAGYMTREASEACARTMRLPDGAFWPVPIVLDVSAERAAAVADGSPAVLRDPEGAAIAILHVAERALVARTGDERYQLAGRVEGIALPGHRDFRDLRRTPGDVRSEAARRGWTATIAWQADQLVHRAQIEAASTAARERRAGLLLQTVIPAAGPAAEREYSLVRGHRAAVAACTEGEVLAAVLPWRAGVRPFRDGRALALRAILARNHGCAYILVNQDEAAAIRAAEVPLDEIGVESIAPAGLTAAADEEVASRVEEGSLEPAFTFPAVLQELRRMFPPRERRGLTLFFTGLSGSGKSTIANAVRIRLLERGARRVTMLDGDLVRQHLSSELGFSREHRELNIRRIGFVAAEITRHGGVAICAPIAPYDATRREVRQGVQAAGAFVLVFVDTPLAVCEARDPKGLYARARAGLIPAFTGVSDPYEVPGDAEITIRTAETSVEEAADRVIGYLERAGYLQPASRD